MQKTRHVGGQLLQLLSGCKCGGAGVVWELLIPLLCLNQDPFCGVSALTASFLRINDFSARKRFIIELLGEFFLKPLLPPEQMLSPQGREPEV